MRHGRAYRVDTTHKEIRDGLRQLGCSVLDTSQHGGGFPDLVVGLFDKARGERLTVLVECKTPRKRGGRGAGETDEQATARAAWRGGPWLVVVGLVDAAQQLGLEHELVERLAIRIQKPEPKADTVEALARRATAVEAAGRRVNFPGSPRGRKP
jgi:hypothetical protein